MSYKLEIKKCLDNRILEFGDIFDFEDTPNEKLFSDYHIFCRENLDFYSKIINPSIFIYKQGFKRSAGANFRNNHFIISINSHLIIWAKENLLENKHLQAYIEKYYPKTFMLFDMPLNSFYFHICTKFTYYHELAHLFQLEKKKEEEKTSQSFDIKRHYLEINADTYSAISIASHIKACIGEYVSEEDTKNTVIILCSSLFYYLMTFSSNQENLYFEKDLHPHPIIRLFNILVHILNYLKGYPHFKKMNLLPKSLLQSIFSLYHDLEQNNIFDTNIKHIMDDALSQKDAIIDYWDILNQFNLPNYNNAMDIWNQDIS